MKDKKEENNIGPFNTASELTPTGKRLMHQVDRYIEDVKEKSPKAIPSVAGLCRRLGIGRGELISMLRSSVTLADRLFTVFEDEALSAEASSGVFQQHMRILEELREAVGSAFVEEDGGSGLTVVFEHPDGEEAAA